MTSESFIDILMNGDEKTINEFLLKNGKRQKPICPIYFLKDKPKEEMNHEGRESQITEDEC